MPGDLKVGLACSDTPRFFEDIARHLSAEFETVVFSERKSRLPLVRGRVDRLAFMRDMRRFLRGVDVAFFEWASHYLVAATRLPKQCRIVTRLHQYELFRVADRVNWDAVDRVILVSTGMQRAFAHYLPDHAHKTVVIPGGVRLDRFVPVEREFAGNLGMLANLEPRKRIYETILAASKLVRRGHDVRLFVGGAQHPRFLDYEYSMRRLVGRLGLGDRVTFDGRVDDAPAWFRKIDVHISNSYAEGLQVSPMEAIASGCYSVCHDWDGCEDVFSDSEIFVAEDDLVRLLEAYIAAAEPERRAVRERQRERIVEYCDMERVARAITGVIRDAAGAGGARAAREAEPEVRTS